MKRKFTKKKKEELAEMFKRFDLDLRDSGGIFILFNFMVKAAELLKLSVPDTLEMIMREFPEGIQARLQHELKQAGVPKGEIDNTIAIIMRMVNPWISENSDLVKSRRMLMAGEKEVLRKDKEGGFGC